MTSRWVWIAVMALGCAPRTELVVSVDSDMEVPSALDEVRFDVVEPSGRRSVRVAPLLGHGAAELPVTLVLAHEAGPLGPLSIRVSGFSAGSEVVRTESVAWFFEGRSLLVPLGLSSDCREIDCSDGTTCVGGVCVNPPRHGPDGSAFADGGRPSLAIDGSTPDAAPIDAGRACAAGCVCSQSCEEGCSCGGGCGCDLRCGPGEDCRAGRCSGAGTRCAIAAPGAASFALACENGATCTFDVRGAVVVEQIGCRRGAHCDVDCSGAESCAVRCEEDADCRVDCTDTSSCAIVGCGELGDEGVLRSCGGGILVCNRPCP